MEKIKKKNLTLIMDKPVHLYIIELCYTVWALEQHQGNRTKTAKDLNVSLRKLRMKPIDAKRHGILTTDNPYYFGRGTKKGANNGTID